MSKKLVLIRGVKGNYFTSDGVKIYYPEHKLQKEIEKGAIKEPFIFLKDIKIKEKGTTCFINGIIERTKKLSPIEIMDYIKEKEYSQLLRISTDDMDFVYAIKKEIGKCDKIMLLADIGNGLEAFNSIKDNGKNNTRFLKVIATSWVRGLKKVDIMLYQDIAKIREYAKEAIEIDKEESIYLGAYLLLKNIVEKGKKEDIFLVDNKYVRLGNVVCFRTRETWYMDSMNFIPYLGYNIKEEKLDVELLENYIIENMLTYKKEENEIISKRVYVTDTTYYDINLMNIYIIDYYTLIESSYKSKIEECKKELEEVRKKVGKNVTRTNVTILQNLNIRNVLELNG